MSIGGICPEIDSMDQTRYIPVHQVTVSVFTPRIRLFLGQCAGEWTHLELGFPLYIDMVLQTDFLEHFTVGIQPGVTIYIGQYLHSRVGQFAAYTAKHFY